MLLTAFQSVRNQSVALCANLETEDYVVQPTLDASPAKWHLAHITWFWETFVLMPYMPGYQVFHDDFSYVFNSYYETVGKRVLRTQRGNLSRPTVAEVYRYRAYVDEHMAQFLATDPTDADLRDLVILGLNHEQQHQELLVTDIKYTLGHNPLLPPLNIPVTEYPANPVSAPITVPEGIYTIGYQGSMPGDSHPFHFDNELGVHKVYLAEITLAGQLITNGEYLEFMEAGGYRHFGHWLADGWAWVNANAVQAPLYWHNIDGQWHYYTFGGLVPVDPTAPVSHVSQYEADAFARWRGTRLPTEFEWEAAAGLAPLNWGLRWEWTNSAYLPYPGFVTAGGAVGEYNGKFMSNQLVLRGGSVATPAGHSRPTYRNFFQPDKQWQYTGIRLIQA